MNLRVINFFMSLSVVALAKETTKDKFRLNDLNWDMMRMKNIFLIVSDKAIQNAYHK